MNKQINMFANTPLGEKWWHNSKRERTHIQNRRQENGAWQKLATKKQAKENTNANTKTEDKPEKNNKQIRNRGNIGDAWTKIDKQTKSKGTTQT